MQDECKFAKRQEHVHNDMEHAFGGLILKHGILERKSSFIAEMRRVACNFIKLVNAEENEADDMHK